MLRQRSISAVGVILVTAIPGFFGGPLFVVTVLAIALLGLHELLAAFTDGSYRTFPIAAFAGTVALLMLSLFDVPAWVYVSVTTLIVLGTLVFALARQPVDGTLIGWALSVAAILYIGLPLAQAIALRDLNGASEQHWVNRLSDALGSGDSARGLSWFAFAVAVTWLNDSAAYLVGRRFGRVRLVPRLSPGKTREGALGGVCAGAIAGVLAALLFGTPIPIASALIAGAVLSVSGQLGDLAESLIKRNLGIKDMGTLIPGHGGILDRIDALLFTLPMTYALARLAHEVSWT